MRFGYTLLVAGALSLGIGIQAQADNFLSHKAGNVTISLPSGWEVLPKGVLKQFSQENGPEILLLAQGPADDFLKLSIIRNPDPGTQEAFPQTRCRTNGKALQEAHPRTGKPAWHRQS